MKKTFLTVLLGALGSMVLAALTAASPVLAATSISFVPVNVSVVEDKTFTLKIVVNPQGYKNYTAKTELHYPADLLEVKSFTLAKNWIPLPQAGYDFTDNKNGVLIKTAGYPGGVSSAVSFGTVSFLAKKTGDGIIALNSNSFVLDANNKNVLAGASVKTAVAISALAPTETTPKTPRIQTAPPPPAKVPATAPVQIAQETPVVQEQPTTASQPTAQSLLTSVSSASTVTLGTGNLSIDLLVAAAAIFALGYLIAVIVQRVRRKNLGKER